MTPAEKMIAELLKPMEWTPYVTNDGPRGVTATTPFGRYLCVPSGWMLVGQSEWTKEPTLSAAQAAAHADCSARVAAILDADKIVALVSILEESKIYVGSVARYREDHLLGAVAENESRSGMTLRDWFAGQALSWAEHDNWTSSTPKHLAERAYQMADAMLEARK